MIYISIFRLTYFNALTLRTINPIIPHQTTIRTLHPALRSIRPQRHRISLLRAGGEGGHFFEGLFVEEVLHYGGGGGFHAGGNVTGDPFRAFHFFLFLFGMGGESEWRGVWGGGLTSSVNSVFRGLCLCL